MVGSYNCTGYFELDDVKSFYLKPGTKIRLLDTDTLSINHFYDEKHIDLVVDHVYENFITFKRILQNIHKGSYYIIALNKVDLIHAPYTIIKKK